ncbi:DUF3492 domain-containing protein [Corynebacterium cystitidis]|uniref:DUF3492 domain-containing protein n=1 Tax=Corynebacterium cystitidis DSM 20524 TaxID=1121357 RepID=A0A1H9QMQ6_9CORY|nr:DUF3492 domain-containing protein [Corynebacterium cystitidis]SER61023.1 protein of unknown function [Corynebacterium cystitidis DSM 20524]SNV84218.1 Domain of uncharacterised function (DUF3492) [Corynebacterium cystitidis]
MTYAPYRRLPGDTTQLPHVDVALVMESTYPYLKGGLSGVVHDIILNHPHLTFGIIFTTWDSSIELSPQYAVPSNVKWVDVIYLSFEENKEQFVEAVLTGQHPERAAWALASALHNLDAMWELYDDYINPLTRTDSVWSALTSRTLMKAMCKNIRRPPCIHSCGVCGTSSPWHGHSQTGSTRRRASTTHTPPGMRR